MVVCSNPYVRLKSPNVEDVNWVSCPVTSFSGIPYSSKIDFMCLMTVIDVIS